GAQVTGYRSDMTRTLFVGDPTARDLAVYELVARAQAAAIEALETAVAGGAGSHCGHGTGHGIGLATHEAPNLGTAAPETPLPSPTVFSVEPGVYLEGEMGVRIEDLVAVDA